MTRILLVEQREQPPAGVADPREIRHRLEALLRLRILGQDLGVADDLVQRTAQVMQKLWRDGRGHGSRSLPPGRSNASIFASSRGSSIGFVS